ncbi:type II secretion system F family protein [Arabiibacter massiliensis]|uniref:type II secretion system F family protein n=1 Tax=Arabiibacter massiliensis TaxID=1870985 RepID=UPI000B424E4F|nr:type II secretion system F family protein [Arabiibacter massiliensis]
MMAFSEASLLLVGAAASAAGLGACVGASWQARRRSARRRRDLRRSTGVREEGVAAPGLDGRVVRFAVDCSRGLSLGASGLPFVRGRTFARVARWLGAHAPRAGLAGEVSPGGFVDAAAKLALACGAVGALAGAVLSNELGALGAVVGCAVGAMALPRAVKRLERARALGLERDLSEMLEVVALGLRSGLSFDRGFQLYAGHFSTVFADECAAASRAWSSGLATREEALRRLAASYDSPLFARVVENVVRSLRFGAQLAEALEAAAVEARSVHRAHVEERVAKAPVKMMVPTGTLILPAMLLLVLGPVLLELMEGF